MERTPRRPLPRQTHAAREALVGSSCARRVFLARDAPSRSFTRVKTLLAVPLRINHKTRSGVGAQIFSWERVARFQVTDSARGSSVRPCRHASSQAVLSISVRSTIMSSIVRREPSHSPTTHRTQVGARRDETHSHAGAVSALMPMRAVRRTVEAGLGVLWSKVGRTSREEHVYAGPGRSRAGVGEGADAPTRRDRPRLRGGRGGRGRRLGSHQHRPGPVRRHRADRHPIPQPDRHAIPGPTPSTATIEPIDTSTWTPYTSDRYHSQDGPLVGHPPDWTVVPATREWRFDTDAADPRSPAHESFVAPSGDVRVSVWEVPLDTVAAHSECADRGPALPGVRRVARLRDVLGR